MGIVMSGLRIFEMEVLPYRKQGRHEAGKQPRPSLLLVPLSLLCFLAI